MASTAAPKDEAKDEAKAAPQSSTFKQSIKESDDPMIQMLKEWMNMEVEKYGNLEGAAWNQVKDVYKAVKDYVTEQDSPSEQQTNTDTPKPKPTPLTEEQLEAYKVLGLNQNKPVDPQVVHLATTLKIEELDKKMSGSNDQIKGLGDKLSADYDKLEKDYDNQQPPMSHEDYEEKHKALYDQYLNDYSDVTKEFDSYASQRADCLMAHDVLLNKPTLANDSTDAPPLGMTGGGDTRTLGESVKGDELPALEGRQEETVPENLAPDDQVDNVIRPGE